MKRLLALTFAASTLSVTAYAITAPKHVRGTVTAISDGSITVHTNAGRDVTLALGGLTHYVKVEKASLSDIDTHTFIGTATKNVGNKLVALEVAVFPNSMRGTGEGYYPWGMMPDTTQSGGGMVKSSMTNGTVANESSPGAPGMVKSSMTNGTVSGASNAGEVRQLTVTYKGGENHILVPPTAPIVKLEPGTMSEVSKGDAVFINESKNSSSPTAAAVLFGVDGVTPPM